MIRLGALVLALLLSAAGLAARAWLIETPATPATPLFPLKSSPTGRYLTYFNGAPLLIMVDSEHATSQVPVTGANSLSTVWTQRQAQNFNGIQILLLCGAYVTCPADLHDVNGNTPFTANLAGCSGSAPICYDMTKPNSAYWSRIDTLINTASTFNFLVIIDVFDTAACNAGTDWQMLQNNGAANAATYGTFLANRYKSFANIEWMIGNDYTCYASAANDNLVFPIAQAIVQNDPNHSTTMTMELTFNSTSLDDTTNNWASVIGLNGVYSYIPTYVESLHAWNQSSIPNYLIESNFEAENNTGNETISPAAADNQLLRKQIYWAMTSGDTGQVFGNHYVNHFLSGWPSNLNTPGANQAGYSRTFFSSIAWYALVPDQSNTFLTAGFGTSSSANGGMSVNTYATGAVASTPTATYGVVYIGPAYGTGSGASVTINLAQLGPNIIGTWYDPTLAPASGEQATLNCTVAAPCANTGSQSFAIPGANSEGQYDWVLLLTGNPVVQAVPFAYDNALTSAGAVADPVMSNGLNFGTTRISIPAPPQLTVAINTTTGNLTFGGSAVSFFGPNSADFAAGTGPYQGCTNVTLTTIGANPTTPTKYSCAIYVVFTPSVVGTEHATLQLTDSNNNHYTLPVSGSGTSSGTVTTIACGSNLNNISFASGYYILHGGCSSPYALTAALRPSSGVTIQGDCHDFLGATTILDGGQGAPGGANFAGFADTGNAFSVGCIQMQNFAGSKTCNGGVGNGCGSCGSTTNLENWCYTWGGIRATVYNSRVTGSGGTGFGISSGGKILNSRSDHNSHSGIGCGTGAAQEQFLSTEIDHNNTRGDDPLDDVGGVKCTLGGSGGLVGRYNYVHDNASGGLWKDIGTNTSDGTTDFSYNTVVNNNNEGIRFECSNNVVGDHNVIIGNAGTGAYFFSIGLAGSLATETKNNYIKMPSSQSTGAIVLESRVGSGCNPASNFTLTGNIVVFTTSGSGNQIYGWSFSGGSNNSSNNNTFYESSSLGDQHFQWQGSGPSSFSSYQASSGQDAASTNSVGSGPTMLGCTVGPGCQGSGM